MFTSCLCLLGGKLINLKTLSLKYRPFGLSDTATRHYHRFSYNFDHKNARLHLFLTKVAGDLLFFEAYNAKGGLEGIILS